MHPQRSSLSRRQFFARSAAAAGTASLGGGLFDGLVARAAFAGEPQGRAGIGYGPLRPAGEDLALPAGFQYRVIANEGDPMDDGFPTPKAMDGMATFAAPNGNIILVRNHEDGQAGNTLRPRPAGSTSTSAGILNSRLQTHYGPRAFAYDEFAAGGTTTLEVEPHGQRRLVRQYWSLVGTVRNCAGGLTPWGSWLSSEETLDGPTATGYAQNHGYNFEVPIDTVPGTPAPPNALKHLGRFAHEAVAVDPATGVVYETEDQGDGSGFYRYVPAARPTRPGDLEAPTGRLQMLKVVGVTNYEAAIGQDPSVSLQVEWVNIANPDPIPVSQADPVFPTATISTVFAQGLALGGARFRRLEGCWYDAGKIYFISTNGGNQGFGQVWVHDIGAQTIRMVVESTGHNHFDGPDNCCVSPSGGLVFCEDATAAQHLRGVSRDGEVFDLARNLRNTIEFAGVCFSPDGNTLFANLYGRGNERTTTPYRATQQIPVGPEKFERAATVAIWGPWKAGPL